MPKETPEGLQLALKTFRDSAKNVSAYQNFLRSNKIDPVTVKSSADFLRVPIMEKKNYLYKYSLKDLFPKNKVAPMIYASSGSSGKPTFWFRGDEQEEMGADIHQEIFSKTFGLNKQSEILVVICFSMGVWVAGNYTAEVCRRLSRRGWNLTTVTPGVEKEDIFNVLENLAPQFKNVILAGYPPFLMDVVVQAKQKKIKLKSKFFGLTAGDKFSEEWRTAFLKQIGSKSSNDISAIYGCADAGVLGYETKFSILLRTEALKNKDLYKELFADEKVLPALVQYDPSKIYFEEVEGELVFTTATAIPLIRYNIHDVGKVYSVEETKEIINKFGLTKSLKGQSISVTMPLLVKKGRTDVAVTFYALNVYPEHIHAGLQDREISKYLTGNYSAYNLSKNKHKDQQLHFKLELASGVKPSKSIQKTVQECLIRNLLKHNIEYRKLRSAIGAKSDPIVELVKNNDDVKVSHQAIFNIKGKKPRIILAK